MRIKEPTCYLGIDPGVSGGLAALCKMDNQLHVLCHQMPSTDLDLAFLMSSFSTLGTVYCTLERVASMPKQGVKSTFTFGENYGKLQMALACNEYSYETVRPSEWQRELGIPAKKKTEKPLQHKEKLRATAQKLYPKIALWHEPLTKQRGVCDALLLAHYGFLKRNQTGEQNGKTNG